ncbi:MAG: polysaccharide biosynthesis protein [Clostridiales bacterium]|nr:polysaccharide biosynthesis protein [Clostridiales bacterium]
MKENYISDQSDSGKTGKVGKTGNTDRAGIKKSTNLFFSGVLILTITNIIVKLIGLFFKIPMQKHLGNEGMGYFNSAYQIYAFFYMISTAGLPLAVSIMVSENRAKGNFRQVRRIYRLSMTLFFTIGLLGMSVMLFGARGLAEFIDTENVYYCIVACAPTLFLICIASAWRGYFQGYQNMLPIAVSQLLEALGKLFIGIMLALWAISQGYSLPVVAAFAMLGLTIGVAAGTIYLALTKLFFRERKYNAEYAHADSDNMPLDSRGNIMDRLVRIAFPVTISSSVMSLANVIDVAIVSRALQANGLTQEAAAALYGNYTTLAVPMFNLPPVLIYPISYSIVPMLTALLTNKHMTRAKTVMLSSIKTTAIIALPCALGMSVMAGPILSLFFDPASVEIGAPLLSILALAVFFVGLIAITNAILQSYKKPALPIWSMVIGAAVKLVTSSILISNPKVGMYGAPIGTLLCYITVTVINFYFIAKYTGVIPSVKKMFLRPLIAAVLAAVSAMGTYYLLERIMGAGRLVTLLAIVAAAFVYFVTIFLIRGISKEEVLLLPKGQRIYSALHRMRLM